MRCYEMFTQNFILGDFELKIYNKSDFISIIHHAWTRAFKFQEFNFSNNKPNSPLKYKKILLRFYE